LRKTKVALLEQLLQSNGAIIPRSRDSRLGTKIFPTTAQECRAITARLRKQELQHFTYQIDLRQDNNVIRGIYCELDISTVEADLHEQGNHTPSSGTDAHGHCQWRAEEAPYH
jgi:hypothetical protein